MPTSLSPSQHRAVVATSGRRLIDLAIEAGLDAPVPTCPAWDVRALLAHQAMVHLWSTAHLRGTDPDAVPDQTALRDEADVIGLAEGALDGVVRALAEAPDDLQAMTFLNDAPAPVGFWARRQAHETTVHMIDALAASLGREPLTAEAAIDREVAVDGLDELLRGFFTRGRSKLFDGEPFTFVVAPTDTDVRWVVRVDERLSVDPPDADASAVGDATVLSGAAAALYLALWNRGADVTVSGAGSTLMDRWRGAQRVRWS
ncbi:MAG: maleylpyruvate isomerase N-terminal domain-containing protein [Acidimicrobiales bacterium]